VFRQLDVVTFAAAPVALIAVAAVAVWIPARRATLVDPMVALREE
jgi:ABC-type lipoprotein release transport system permease subunit